MDTPLHLRSRPTNVHGFEPRGVRSTSSSTAELVTVWSLWIALLTAIFVTYTRLDPTQLYHVSREGITGGWSRTLVALNFPVAMIAIAIALIALDRLQPRAWWVGAPAIALCAVTAWPGVVDDQDLDARPVNIVPAIGVALALALTVAAMRRLDSGFAARRPLDGFRVVIVAVFAVLSVPWVLADLGVFAPEWVFIMERPTTGSDGTTIAAVHLGHHHGLDGALFVVSAALLSRVRLRTAAMQTATTLYLSLVFAYGAVNFAQDGWHEQVVKRGWSGSRIPDATNPSLTPIWLLILGIAGVTAFTLERAARGDGRRAPDDADQGGRQ